MDYGPPGAGKTTLVASYLENVKLRSLWYQVDEGDADVATFFYYLGLAIEDPGRKGSPRLLPLLTPEYHAGLSTFTRHFFQSRYQQLGSAFALVFDGYHEVPAQSQFHTVMRGAVGNPARQLHHRDQPQRSTGGHGAAARESHHGSAGMG